MSLGVSMLPVYLVDLLGAICMIFLSTLAFNYALRLTRLEPKNVLWSYLFWLCMTLVAFSLSRSIGHVLHFVWSGQPHLLVDLTAFSGGFNSLAFVAAGMLTLYYNTMHAVIEKVALDAEELNSLNENLLAAQESLHIFNHTLEVRVAERTKQLAISEQKFRHLFEGTKDLIFFCDDQGNISDINDSGVELLGHKDKDEVVGHPLAIFFVEQKRWGQYCHSLTTNGHVKDFEIELHRKDGSPLHLILTASAIRNNKGDVQGCEGIAKDLTRFKEVASQLLLSEKMASVGQLAAGVAHEINTPLGIILGYSQLLAEDLHSQPDILENLKIVEKQTKACKRIVSDLLKFSRNSADVPDLQESDVNRCVADVLTIMEHSLKMDKIKIHHFLTDLPKIKVDRGKLRQVFVNLINNAHDAIVSEGVVGIWTKFDEESYAVEIIIADTGLGISSKIIGQIFDPFFTTKGVGKGTGMGLSVSFGIIKELGGNLEAQSPPARMELAEAGMNTSFHIKLPVGDNGTI